DGGDDRVGVLRVQAKRERVDAAELLEQHCLPLHDRHRRLGPDIPEPEDGAAVRHDGDGVALARVLEGLVAIPRDRARDAARARPRSAAIFTVADVSGAAAIRPIVPNRAPPAIVTMRTDSGWIPRAAPKAIGWTSCCRAPLASSTITAMARAVLGPLSPSA